MEDIITIEDILAKMPVKDTANVDVNWHRDEIIAEIIKKLYDTADSIGSLFLHTKQSLAFWNGYFFEKIDDSKIDYILSRAAIQYGMPINYASHHLTLTNLRRQALREPLDFHYVIDEETSRKQLVLGFKNYQVIISRSGEFKVQRPDRYLANTYYFNINFTLDAKCPIFTDLINYEINDHGIRNALYDYLGSCLIPYNHPYNLNIQKCLLITGPTNTGKSVFASVVNSVLGINNCTHFSLSALSANQSFLRALLLGKIINIANDTENRIEDENVFKSLISGEPRTENVKYEQPVYMPNYARLLIIGNHYPTTADPDNAYQKRLLPIRFSVPISESKIDPNLTKKIIDFELEGVFILIFDGLIRCLRRNAQDKEALVLPEALYEEMKIVKMEAARDQYHVSDYLIDRGIAKSSNLNNCVKQQFLFTCYLEWANINHMTPVATSSQSFAMILLRLGYQRIRKNGTNYFVCSIDGQI